MFPMDYYYNSDNSAEPSAAMFPFYGGGNGDPVSGRGPRVLGGEARIQVQVIGLIRRRKPQQTGLLTLCNLGS